MHKNLLPALTGIRFFLALWVVIYHQIPPLETAWIASVFHTGYSAVTAFFVLSGFVLAYNYDLSSRPSRQAVRLFAAARFSRIYPAYLAALLFLVPLALYRLSNGIEIATPANEWSSFLLNLLLLQAWLPDTALTWNFPGWSLSNEAFFYVCFPLVGHMLWRLRRPSAIAGMFLFLWFLACAAPLASVWWATSPTWDHVIRYNPLIRLPEFCAGVLLAKFYIGVEHQLKDRGHWFYLPSGLALGFVLIQSGRIPVLLMHNGLLVPLFGGVLLGLALGGGIIAKWLSTSTLVLLGNASYSMYILHAPITNWLNIFFRRALNLEPSGWTWFWTYLIVTILASLAFYKFAEDPLHRWLRSALNRSIQNRDSINRHALSPK